jgi:hypothetical protein
MDDRHDELTPPRGVTRRQAMAAVVGALLASLLAASVRRSPPSVATDVRKSAGPRKRAAARTKAGVRTGTTAARRH